MRGLPTHAKAGIFLVMAVAVACGGKGSLRLRSPDAASAGTGGVIRLGSPDGAALGTGGVVGTSVVSGAGGALSAGTGGSSAPTLDAGVTADSGGSEAAPPCYVGYLWDAISDAAGVIGYCNPSATWKDGALISGADAGFVWGYVVIDNTGRVVDNSCLFGERKQAWLDGLSNKRFACVAGYTISYDCYSE